MNMMCVCVCACLLACLLLPGREEWKCVGIVRALRLRNPQVSSSSRRRMSSKVVRLAINYTRRGAAFLLPPLRLS
ncbi:hypothetical protein F4811DRAFT_545328 [Daldinia bambusicola]|nr:hypothetical protein F4811DRAFT_545328 [Daldinia bambusicola]